MTRLCAGAAHHERPSFGRAPRGLSVAARALASHWQGPQEPLRHVACRPPLSTLDAAEHRAVDAGPPRDLTQRQVGSLASLAPTHVDVDRRFLQRRLEATGDVDCQPPRAALDRESRQWGSCLTGCSKTTTFQRE